jgi:hypothetical protein
VIINKLANTTKLPLSIIITIVLYSNNSNAWISLTIDEKIANDFNEYLNNLREKYNSLFLTNYRESKKIARKRISFDLAYKIVGMLLKKYSKKNVKSSKSCKK